MQVLSSDLVKQEFRNINFRLSKIEGKLEGFEKVCGQLQGDIRILKLQVHSNEDKGRSVEKVIDLHDQDLQDLSEDLE